MRRLAIWFPLLLGLTMSFGSSPAYAQLRAATLIAVQGDAAVRRSGTPSFTGAVRKMTLSPGDLVRTGPNGHATLLFSDGSQVKLNVNTVLLIPAAGPARTLPARFGLSSGEVWARITRGRKTRFETPSALAWVRGTELDLIVAPDGSATLTVGEGEVRFENPQGSVLVAEGQQSLARPGQPPTRPVTVNVPFIIQWSNDVQPVALLLEVVYASQDPARLRDALAEAERLPAGSERQQRLGDIRHDRGELLLALEAYEAALRAQPGQVEAMGVRVFRCSGVRADDGLQEPSIPTPEHLNTRTPERLPAAELEARIGQTQLELGRLPESEAALRRALALDPQLIAARTGLVMTLLSRRENAAALAEVRAAVERDPRSALAHTALALALIRTGDRPAARESLARALTLEPGNSQAHAWQSFLLRAEGRQEEAEAEARRAVALAPHSSLARQSLADALFAQSRVREARAQAKEAVTLNALSPGAHVSLGRVLLQEGDLENAVQEANTAVALDPDLERARFLLGVVLAEQRRLDRAATELQRAVALDPGYLEARAMLARVYLEQGREGEAIGVVREALATKPEFAPAHAAMGRVFWQAGRLDEATAEYRRALELEPGSALYHMELARAYFDQNRMPDALAHGLAALDAAPGSSEAHALVGLIYYQTSNLAQASREFQEALSLSRENAIARIGVGLIGSSSNFVREFTQGLLRDPSVTPLFLRPGVPTEVTLGAGSYDSYGLGFQHADRYARGKLYDYSFGNQGYGSNYRDGRPQRSGLAMMNLVAAPGYRTHVLAQYLHSGDSTPLPGSIFNPDHDDRTYSWLNSWDVASRTQVKPSTHVWLHAGYDVSHTGLRNPDAPADGEQFPFDRARFSRMRVEGRLDHRWGGGHTTTYSWYAGRQQIGDRARAFLPLLAAFLDIDGATRQHLVSQTLQNDYQAGSRLSLILGITHDRFTARSRLQGSNGFDGRSSTADTEWLPFGQVTYVLTRRDLVRAIVHRRHERLLTSALQPTEAFLLNTVRLLPLAGKTTNYEFDYERRFSPRAFAKLVLFRTDVDDVTLAPAVTQRADRFGITIPKARVQGFGVRFEHQLTRFLSSYAAYIRGDAEDKTERSTRGRQLPMSPRTLAALGLNYIDRAGTKLFLETNWIGRSFVDPIWSDDPAYDPLAPRPTSPAKMVVNLRLGKERSVRREWSLAIGNVLNTKTILWPGFPALGRTYRLTYAVRL